MERHLYFLDKYFIINLINHNICLRHNLGHICVSPGFLIFCLLGIFVLCEEGRGERMRQTDGNREKWHEEVSMKQYTPQYL